MQLMETTMAQTVARTLDSVRGTGGLGLITAPPGAGKSVAVMMAGRERPHLRRVALIEGLDSARALYWHVAKSVDVEALQQDGAADLIARLQSELGRCGAQLVLDQGQRLRKAAHVDWACCLADTLGSLVLVGPPALRARVTQHEEAASLCTVPAALAEGVSQAELHEALGRDYSQAWIDVVHAAAGGCWRQVHACVAAAERATRRSGHSTRELGAAEAGDLVAAVLLRPAPVPPELLAAEPRKRATGETTGEPAVALATA